jgi:hypothetical protein
LRRSRVCKKIKRGNHVVLASLMERVTKEKKRKIDIRATSTLETLKGGGEVNPRPAPEIGDLTATRDTLASNTSQAIEGTTVEISAATIARTARV